MADQGPNHARVIPNFYVEEVEPLRAFYIDMLGFTPTMGVVGKDGKLDFTIVDMKGINIMIGRPQNPSMKGTKRDAERPIEIYCYVDDVDGYHDHLVKKRVPIAQPIATEWWGDRLFSVKDPYGYTIFFCQTVGEVNPPAGMTLV